MFRTIRAFSLLNETQKLIHDNENDADEKDFQQAKSKRDRKWVIEKVREIE